MRDRLTLTDLAKHLKITRPTCYVLIRSVGFPERGPDKKWDAKEILKWIADNRQPEGARLVGGVMTLQN